MDVDLSIGRRRSGFTLIEVLVALALMALGMLAIAPLFANSMTSNAAGDDFSKLNALAKQQLEQCLQYGFDDPRLAVPTAATITIVDEAGGSTTGAGQLYQNQIALTQTVGGVTTTVPYRVLYTVQNFTLDKMKETALPTMADGVTDSDATWKSGFGGKLITVYGAATRRVGSGTSYTNAGILPSGTTGKQIRLMAYKTP